MNLSMKDQIIKLGLSNMYGKFGIKELDTDTDDIYLPDEKEVTCYRCGKGSVFIDELLNCPNCGYCMERE